MGLRSMIVVPLRHEGENVGVLKAMSRVPDQFDDADVRALRLLSDVVAALYFAAKYNADALFYKATHDAMTGLANRAFYIERLRNALALHRRYCADIAPQQTYRAVEATCEALTISDLGITLTGILMGICTGAFIAPYLASFIAFLPHATTIAMLFSIVVVTYIALLFSEFLPKKKAAQNPERILMKYHRIVARLTHLARPFIRFLSSSASGVLLLLGINPNIEDTVTEDEVKDLIEQGTEDGTFEKSEQAMVDRVFHLSDQTAYALMTPRTQMLWLDLADSLRHNLRIIRENPQNVFPVGRENLDDFCGVLYAKDLLNASLERKSLDLAQYIRKPMFVPRSMETFRVLAKFRDTHGRVFEPDFQQARAIDDWGTQVRLAHTLKGTARTLGAFDLGEAAAHLEAAATRHDRDTCRQCLDETLAQLRRVIDGLQGL